MQPHPTFTKILLKFWVQLHQLTLNAIAQMSKYFWAVLSFGEEPSSDGFAKCYELHYQPKKIAADGFTKFQQSARWMKAWFYCKVPLHPCPRGGKPVHALRSHMSPLNFRTKPYVQDSVEDLSDDALV
jgi:hypothetical protein